MNRLKAPLFALVILALTIAVVYAATTNEEKVSPSVSPTAAAATAPRSASCGCCGAAENPALEELRAEETPAQSVYLSALTMIELERQQGDVYRVIPDLEKLATKASQQPLRNAIRRLIVKLDLERNDYKAADQEIQKIIEESLLQM